MLSVLTYGVIEGALIAMVALAFQLSYSGLKMFDIGIGALYVTASYLFIGIQKNVTVDGFEIPVLVISVLLIFLINIFFVLVIERLVYRPFFKRQASGLVMLLVSLSVYTFIVNGVAILFGTEIQIIHFSLSSITIDFFGVLITKIQLMQIVAALIFLTVVYWLLVKTVFGKKVTALSENLHLFKVLGFSEDRTRQHILIVGTVLVSAASVLKTANIGIEPFGSGFHIVLLAAVAVIVGGITSYKGAILGGFVLGVVMNATAWYFSGEWKEAATFALLVLVLFIKKDGLFYTQLRVEE